MRVPAVSFDPPIAPSAKVTPLTAALAASRTGVSPDARTARLRRPRERWPAEQADPSSQPAAERPVEQEVLPACFPPLVAQRSVLDRSVEPAPRVAPAPAVEADIVLPDAGPGALPPDADSALEQHLRRVMGSLRRGD